MNARYLVYILLFSLFSTPLTGKCQQKDSTYYKKENASGVKKILIDGKFWVWTQKIGDGKINVLLLHGGPAITHENFEIFAKYLPKHGITIYYYDQFGSYFSQDPTKEQLNDTSIWKVSRYVNEIEQVRKGLGLDKFFIYGHSYGALLALAYTYKYPDNIEGMIFSDMNPSQKDFGERYTLASKQTDDLLNELKQYHGIIQNKVKGINYDTNLYQKAFDSTFERNFVLRLDTLPDYLMRTKAHKNYETARKIGPSTFSLDYMAMVPRVKVPVLLIAGQYDFIISSEQVKALSVKFPNAQWYIVPDAAHMCFSDNPEMYFPGIIKFIKKNNKSIK
ncbi:proline iminopeptidase-family hydrolase [Mucilaginibacter sp. X5P1]|uniref:proline iminopeptidase-family hydrolase n=1 Tax=Mucilaginibacter sp. X5P1 TaxID=2723088 RepID=UPI001611B159|nr:proline iminopeptidase-family hydrolase [Mucilaginibacter sp. X5P1]MBB6136994.1 proline iminopeptidase [Mucilaginibacter sp. X5P1]